MTVHSGSRALVLESVSAGYGGAMVVTGIDLSITDGEIATIVGPNGSGKSTLLKAIIGQVVAAEGRIFLREDDITTLDVENRIACGLGYVPQINDVFAPLTVEENLAGGGYLLERKAVKQRILEVMEIFPLLKDRAKVPAGRLSGGERKMLAMGRVLMPRPSVLLLDEPTANLAPNVAQEVLTEHVTRLAEIGNAVLLVEQRVTEALSVATRGHVLVGGRITVSGQGSEVLARPDLSELFLGHTTGRGSGASRIDTLRPATPPPAPLPAPGRDEGDTRVQNR